MVLLLAYIGDERARNGSRTKGGDDGREDADGEQQVNTTIAGPPNPGQLDARNVSAAQFARRGRTTGSRSTITVCAPFLRQR